MPLFYWTVDTSTFILQPQTTRWRSRYRGPRESWKQNLETNQIAYDIYQLYQRTFNDQIAFQNYQYYIEFGSTQDYSEFGFPYDAVFDPVDSGDTPYDSLSQQLSFTITGVRLFDDGIFDSSLGYDSATPSTYPASINGTQDMVRRIQELQFKLRWLEQNLVLSASITTRSIDSGNIISGNTPGSNVTWDNATWDNDTWS